MSRKDKKSPKSEPEAPEAESGADPEGVAASVPEESVESLTEERDQLRDRLLRLTAEYENYRKRLARERASWTAQAVEGLVAELLPALDSFDRAMEAGGDAAALRDGMELVQRQLLSALASHGIEPIEALGRPFDPNLHEGFLSRPAEEGEVPGTIVDEVQKGYRLGDRTIRATKGIVAAAVEDVSPDSGSEEE
jgi:molecular chaperone GrpE